MVLGFQILVLSLALWKLKSSRSILFLFSLQVQLVPAIWWLILTRTEKYIDQDFHHLLFNFASKAPLSAFPGQEIFQKVADLNSYVLCITNIFYAGHLTLPKHNDYFYIFFLNIIDCYYYWVKMTLRKTHTFIKPSTCLISQAHS